jgi:hypothetical protein
MSQLSESLTDVSRDRWSFHLVYFGPDLLPHAQKLWVDELSVGTKRLPQVGGDEAADK